MPRGKNAPVGSTRVSANGYMYTKCDDGWRLTHHLVAEDKLGRPLRKNERVYFKDNDRSNRTPENVMVREVRDRKADRAKELRAKIKIMKDELRDLEAEGY